MEGPTNLAADCWPGNSVGVAKWAEHALIVAVGSGRICRDRVAVGMQDQRMDWACVVHYP